MSVTPMYGGSPYATAAGVEFPWIMATLERRRQERGKVLEAMRTIRDCYNGDLIIPLPELDTTERSSVANLVVTGIDQTAQRIASVLPLVDFPSLRPGFDVHDQRARTRTLACQSWWKANRMSAKMRRRARWLIGYGFAPVVIRPDYTAKIPRWEVRDPLSAYPSPTQDPDDICPTDAIFTYFKSYGWLRQCYPEQIARLRAMTGASGGNWDTRTGPQQYEMIEYVDSEVTVLGVMGPKQFGTQWGESMGIAAGSPFIELERVATPGGMCPAVVPGRITLDGPKGQFDDAIGPYQLQARLMALEVLAVERGVFPDTYLISRPNEVADFVAGPFDGRTGQVNIVKGGDIREQNLNPGFATTGVIDRLERAQRVSASMPAEFGGESQSNVRTGRRGESIISAATSFPIQEAQEVFAEALQEENRRAVAVMKHCFGRAKSSFLVTWNGPRAQAVDYVADEAFDTDVNSVTFPMAGADANSLIVGLGQRVGLGMLSKRSAAELDPMISDPEMEEDRVTAEGLSAALMASLQAQAQQGAIPPADLAMIADFVKKNKGDLFAAVAEVQRIAQERQANAGPPGAPTGPVAPGAPEAQPGLAMPGAGAEQPSVGPAPEGLDNFAGLLQSLGA